MIGKICSISTPYYDSRERQMKIKSRPALIIAQADISDYNVLPISKISDKSKIDPVYDIPIDPNKYPKLNLSVYSYIRTHKQTVTNKSQISKIWGDLKEDYPELYVAIADKIEKYNKYIIDNM